MLRGRREAGFQGAQGAVANVSLLLQLLHLTRGGEQQGAARAARGRARGGREAGARAGRAGRGAREQSAIVGGTLGPRGAATSG